MPSGSVGVASRLRTRPPHRLVRVPPALEPRHPGPKLSAQPLDRGVLVDPPARGGEDEETERSQSACARGAHGTAPCGSLWKACGIATRFSPSWGVQMGMRREGHATAFDAHRSLVPSHARCPSAGPAGVPGQHVHGGTTEVPSVAMDSSGNFVIVWESYHRTARARASSVNVSTITGAPLGSEFQVNTSRQGTRRGPHAAMDASGKIRRRLARPGGWLGLGIFGAALRNGWQSARQRVSGQYEHDGQPRRGRRRHRRPGQFRRRLGRGDRSAKMSPASALSDSTPLDSRWARSSRSARCYGNYPSISCGRDERDWEIRRLLGFRLRGLP